MDKKTILIADDETHILNVLSIKLANAGYNVITAEDGEEAFALAGEHHPDLVITDYQMPGLSGLELCSKLKCNPATHEVPAIMLTARGFSISNEDMQLGNIKEVITKPFSPRQVLTRVHELVGEAAPAMEVG